MSEALDAAWEALDEGRAEDALGHLSQAPDSPGRWAAETLARLELGDLSAAERALQRANAGGGADDADVLWAGGELHLAAWRVEAALAAFLQLSEEAPSVAGFERLALCHDLRGDFGAADEALARAHHLDPEARPLPPRLSPEAFGEVVQQAVSELPERFLPALERVAVLVDPVPGAGAVVGDGLETPPDLLGLFVGTSLLDDSVQASAEMPPQVYLFQRNLERLARSEEELRDEIRVTLFHELGHALGFDEEGVEEMGLG